MTTTMNPPADASKAPSVNVPPRPPPPIVGKVTHHSIELYWEEAMQRLAEVSQKSDGRIRAALQEKADVGGKDWGNVYSGFGKRHIIDGLEPEHKFSYRLSFKNNHGVSEWSQPVVVSTTKEPLTGEHLHKAIRRNDPIELRNLLAKGHVCILQPFEFVFLPLENIKKHLS